MRKFGLLYNLICGTNRRALRRFERVRRAFHVRGVDLRPYCTSTAQSSRAVVMAAQAWGCEAMLAAGGDGTFNELLQATIQAGANLPIGIVPFGSGNVMAHELGLERDAYLLAKQLVGARTLRVPVGMLSVRGTDDRMQQRYFSVAAGLGADARVICGVNPAWKRRLGIGAYYAEAIRQLVFSPAPLPLFRVQFLDWQTGQPRAETVSQLIVERVAYFSSPLIARDHGIPLLTEAFRLVLFKTQQRTTYLQYGLQLLASRSGLSSAPIANIEVAHTQAVACQPLPGEQEVLTEVDGELVGGGTTVEIALVPQAVEMLLPRHLANQSSQ